MGYSEKEEVPQKPLNYFMNWVRMEYIVKDKTGKVFASFRNETDCKRYIYDIHERIDNSIKQMNKKKLDK